MTRQVDDAMCRLLVRTSVTRWFKGESPEVEAGGRSCPTSGTLTFDANLNNGIVYLYKTIMNIDEPTMLLQGDIYALNYIQDQEIPRKI